MRVLGYIPLFYGAEYLEASIKSIEKHVEKIIILYTDKPSQGHDTKIKCPETETELRAIAEAASDKVVWHSKRYGNEGEHRAEILRHAEGYDLVFTLDADEIVDEVGLPHALKLAYESDKRHIGIAGFINFWRSFSWACYDGFIPYRIINLRNPSGQGQVDLKIYHFSTAQNIETIKFKWNVSGHKDELRREWFDIYKNWTPENNHIPVERGLHPVSFNLWLATPFDKTTLPDVLKNHPNYDKHLI